MQKQKNSASIFYLISFYKKKLVFFVILATFLALGFQMVATQRFFADENIKLPSTSSNNLTLNLAIQNNGSLENGDQIIKKAVNLYNDYDELRLPVLDNAGTYYDKVTIKLTLPKNVASDVKYEILAIHGVGQSSSKVLNSRTIVYEAQDVSGRATISIIAKLPKGTISPSISQRLYEKFFDIKRNFWLILAVVIPLISLLYTATFIFYQRSRQKIDLPTNEISAPPMAIPPAIVGVIYQQKVGPREIAATLIDLAERGDIVILDRDRGFAFGKGKFDQRLLGYEKILLSKIFRNNMTSDVIEFEKRINDHFYSKKISIVTAGIYALTTRLGYFKINPQKIHVRYRLLGISGFLIGLACFIYSLLIMSTNSSYVLFFWVGMMISSLVIAFTAGKTPIRTTIGQEVLSNWLAFRKFLCNPKEFPYTENNQEIFQKYLPYAIVLDCEAAWARRFSNHNFAMPDWFLTEKEALGLEDFCLTLFPIVSYVGRSLAALREPGFE